MWGLLSAVRHLKSTGTFLSRWAGCLYWDFSSFPQWWVFWRSSFPHATAQILPVDKMSLAYSLLGTEVMSIPQNPKVLWEQAGHTRPHCYLPDSQIHSVCVCRRTHGTSSLCCDEGQGQAEVSFGRASNPMSLQLGWDGASTSEGHMAQPQTALTLLVQGVCGPLQSRCMTTDREEWYNLFAC